MLWLKQELFETRALTRPLPEGEENRRRKVLD